MRRISKFVFLLFVAITMVLCGCAKQNHTPYTDTQICCIDRRDNTIFAKNHGIFAKHHGIFRDAECACEQTVQDMIDMLVH